MRVLVVLGLMVSLAGAAQAAGARLSERVSLAHGSFSSGGGLTVATELRETTAGGTALCGVWAESAAQSSYVRDEARRSVALASVYVDGRRIAQDLAFLPKIAPQLDYAGAQAVCRAVDLPWRAGRVPQVFMPRRVIQPGTNDTLGNRVSFAQTGAGAMAGALEPVAILRRQIGLVPLSSLAEVAEGRYSSGGGLRVAAEIIAVDGRAMLCGVWSDLPGQVPQTEAIGRAVLAEAEVRIGARALPVDLGALRRVRARADHEGTPANCLETGLDWTPALPRLGIALPARVVYRSTTEEGTQMIRFAPGRAG